MTTTPHIGSKMSLISKSEIRYEGILYNVDPDKNTIALAKVRTFGTEDRPTEHQVQPRDDVYENIIFNANDVKNLIIIETPQPIPSLCTGLPQDPAIVTIFKKPANPIPIGTAPAAAFGPTLAGAGAALENIAHVPNDQAVGAISKQPTNPSPTAAVVSPVLGGGAASEAISQVSAQVALKNPICPDANGETSRADMSLRQGNNPSIDDGDQTVTREEFFNAIGQLTEKIETMMRKIEQIWHGSRAPSRNSG